MIRCVFLMCLVLPVPALGQPREVRPALNDVREDEPAGERPYEMVRADRSEARPPLVDFEDLEGWTVELYGKAVATLERSREQRMWGATSGKLTYRGEPGENRILLRPPRPVPIPGRFTAANIWCFGNNWGWVPRADTPQVELALHLADADGANHRVVLGRVRWEEWWLVHRRVVEHLGAEPRFPFTLAAIEVSGGHQKDDRAIFLDSLSFYEEEWPELDFAPRPKRGVEPFDGQDQGLNTGPGKLPFPTREETILPANFEKDFRVEARKTEEPGWEFRYEGSDSTVVYSVFPAPGELGSIRVSIDGRPAARALAGAGVRLEGESAPPDVRSIGMVDGVLRVEVEHNVGRETVSVELRYRLWQKSLVVDVICRGGRATELDLGAFEDIDSPEAIPIPFANYGGQSHVLLARTSGKPFFGSVWIDWYRSSGSELFTRREVRKGSARVNGGVRYRPKTDGRRNDLYERIFLTVSPVFEETLPTIANPPSRWAHVAGERLWQESWGPGSFEKEHERSRRLRAYGIEKLIQCNHEIAWRDNADSFTLRIHAAPKKGGDEALKGYVAKQKSLGWRSGLYTNYTDFAPVNENWDEHKVQLEPNREWRTAWPRCYALKPSRAVELDARYAPLIKKIYDPDAAYTDVHTAVAPWHYCDYDARVPGAGTFAATVYAYGELLLNDSRVYEGPIFSEGTYQCIYAGLPDGNYAIHYGGYDFARDPILPHFDLYKIHPLSTDIGMGWTGNFCKWEGWNRPENISASIDRFILTTMAYGHIGWLVEESHGIGLACRSYYMLQQLAKLYALRPPHSIEYFDGEKLLSTSDALARGAHRDSQLKVVYEGGLELWLNGSREKSWQLDPHDGGHLLPPAGWYARSRDRDFEEVSALRDGHRHDAVRSKEYRYLDGRGRFLIDGACAGLAARGSAAVRRREQGRIEIIDIGGNGEIGFRAEPRGAAAPGSIPAALEVEAFDVEGTALGAAEVRWTCGWVEESSWCWVLPHDGGVRYEARRLGEPSAAVRLVAIPSAREVAPGMKIALKVSVEPAGGGLSAIRVCAGGEPVDIEETTGAGGVRTVSLRIPPTARPDEALWLHVEADLSPPRGEAEKAFGWAVLAPRRLADLKTTPETVLLRGGRGSLRIAGHLGLAGGSGMPSLPGVLVFETPEWLAVEPREIEAAGGLDREIVLEAARPQEGLLRAVISAEEAREVLEFDVLPGEARPAELRLDDGHLPFSWGYRFRGGEERGGDTSTGALFRVEQDISSGGVKRSGLFSHPPYIGGVGYSFAEFEPVRLPAGPCELHLYIGLKDGGDASDGVDFIVEAVRDDGVKVELLRESTAERAWREVTADLDAVRGRKVVLRLVADVGSKDSSTADWASWGEPVVRLKEAVPTLTLRRRP